MAILQRSHLVANLIWAKEMMGLVRHKILRHEDLSLLPFRIKVCCAFLSPLKIHRLGWV
jgi:hypothetical protein